MEEEEPDENDDDAGEDPSEGLGLLPVVVFERGPGTDHARYCPYTAAGEESFREEGDEIRSWVLLGLFRGRGPGDESGPWGVLSRPTGPAHRSVMRRWPVSGGLP